MSSPSARRRALGLLVAIAGAGATVFLVLGMARRLADELQRSPRVSFVFRAVSDREFKVHGRPVSLRDETDDAGILHVAISYGEQAVRLRATIPGDPRLPGLLPHEDWLRAMRFAPLEHMSLRELQSRMDAGEVRERVAVVTRSPPAGVDPRTWGEVMRKKWVFDFYEFMEDGTLAHQRLAYPTGRSADPVKPGQLVPGSWEYQAALQIMPPGQTPAIRHAYSPLKAASWRFPAAIVSVMAVVAGLAVAAAPDRARPAAPA